MLDGKEASTFDRGPAHAGQNPDTFLVIPVVQDVFEQVSIGGRDLLEHITGQILAAVREVELGGPQAIGFGDDFR